MHQNALINDKLESLLTMLQVKPLEEDVFVWWRNKLGFSVKSCYQVLQSIFDSDVQVEENIIHLLYRLWLMNASSKILRFGWRLLLNYMLTRVALAIAYESFMEIIICFVHFVWLMMNLSLIFLLNAGW